MVDTTLHEGKMEVMNCMKVAWTCIRCPLPAKRKETSIFFFQIHVSCCHNPNIKYQLPSRSSIFAYGLCNTDIKFRSITSSVTTMILCRWKKKGPLALDKKAKFGTTQLLENGTRKLQVKQTHYEIAWLFFLKVLLHQILFP